MTDNFISAVVANKKGEIFELKGYSALGMVGRSFVPLTNKETYNVPFGTEFMFLPERVPILFNRKNEKIEAVSENPYKKGEKVYPVATFNSPGYVITHIPAYEETDNCKPLPLFSYGAVGLHKDKFRSAIILVDKERRQDLRLMKIDRVIAGVKKTRNLFPKNRLVVHLEKCALTYGCPAAKNFFIGRYEAPLPTSQACNAKCLGCISLQEKKDLSNCQERIAFTPSPEEIAEVALLHIKNVQNPVVSFGQGCEGDPLLSSDVIEEAVKTIRAKTCEGTININTNASRPNALKKLFDAGIDSIRVSLNSVREECYNAYFRPARYNFSDVIESIDIGISNGKFVSINYLNLPGFTDTIEEVSSLISFIKAHPINMIQWRNLNFDPLYYLKTMYEVTPHTKNIGMKMALIEIKKAFPKIKFGYFNPPKEKFIYK
ncbi:MAG: radical SAM protein [Desulfobacterales bacterium]|nr:radical SAM protein [Desulfobacterales bacterium]